MTFYFSYLSWINHIENEKKCMNYACSYVCMYVHMHNKIKKPVMPCSCNMHVHCKRQRVHNTFNSVLYGFVWIVACVISPHSAIYHIALFLQCMIKFKFSYTCLMW